MAALLSSIFRTQKTEKRQSTEMQTMSPIANPFADPAPETDPLLCEMGAMRDKGGKARRPSLPLDNLDKYTSFLDYTNVHGRTSLPLDNIGEDMYLLGELKDCNQGPNQEQKTPVQDVSTYYHHPAWQTSGDKTLLLRVDWSTVLEIMEEVFMILFERHEARRKSRNEGRSLDFKMQNDAAARERRDEVYQHIRGAMDGRTNQLVRSGCEPFFVVDAKGRVVKHRIGGEGKAIEKIAWLKVAELTALGDEPAIEEVGLGIAYYGATGGCNEKQRTTDDTANHDEYVMVERTGATVVPCKKKVSFNPEVEVKIVDRYKTPTAQELLAEEGIDFKRLLMGQVGPSEDLSYVSAESVGQLSPKLPKEL